MRYDAFISYRHAPLDMEIAKKVHTALETYHIPRAVSVKTGKKKMGRVFRDQEELPIGSDLDDNISTALEGSENLIVICSPRTPDSYWVCKEIESFIEMHGRDHVLAILIEGEPDESFPALLLTDDDGNPVEPLAADVRGADKKERNTKFKTEILRLLAPIIGCSYDDLKQRHRERVIKRIATIVSAAALVIALAATAFGIYNNDVAKKMKRLADENAALADEKTKLADEILEEYSDKQINQSRFYAEESLSLLSSGYREDAVMVAKEALPSAENERPYVAEAEYALSRSMYAYDDGADLTPEKMLPQDMNALMGKRSVDQKLVVTVDSGHKVYVYETENWELKTSITPGIDDTGFLVRTVNADIDDTGVYVTTQKAYTKYDLDGNVIFDTAVDSYITGSLMIPELNEAVCISNDLIYEIDLDSGKVLNTIENPDEYTFVSTGCLYDPVGGHVAVAHYEKDTEHTRVSLITPGEGVDKTVDVSGGYVLNMYASSHGNVAVLTCNSNFGVGRDVEYVNLELLSSDGNVLWKRTVPENIRYASTFESKMKIHSYDNEGTDVSEIVVTLEKEAFGFNEENGELISKIALRGDAVGLTVGLDHPICYVGYSGGGIDIIRFDTGLVYDAEATETCCPIRDFFFANSDCVVIPFGGSDIRVLSRHKASDLKDLGELDDRGYIIGFSSEGGYYALRKSMDFEVYGFYDGDGKKLYEYTNPVDYYVIAESHGKDFYVFNSDRGACIDPIAGTETEFDLDSMGVEEHLSEMFLSENGRYLVGWSMKYLAVIDLREQKKIYEMKYDSGIGTAAVSEDGNLVAVSLLDENLFVVDITTEEEYSFDSKQFQSISDLFNKKYMAISHDGSKVAMFCRDGHMRIADIKTGKTLSDTVKPARSDVFVRFTDDDNYLVYQGEDQKISVWDVIHGRYVSSVDASYTIKEIVCDAEDHLLAATDFLDVYLIETEGYGQVAYVSDAGAYLADGNKFILVNDYRYVYSTCYKDYHTLLGEADAFLKDSTLDPEKRVKYNMD